MTANSKFKFKFSIIVKLYSWIDSIATADENITVSANGQVTPATHGRWARQPVITQRSRALTSPHCRVTLAVKTRTQIKLYTQLEMFSYISSY